MASPRSEPLLIQSFHRSSPVTSFPPCGTATFASTSSGSAWLALAISAASPATFLVYYTVDGVQTSSYSVFVATTPSTPPPLAPSSGTVLAYSDYITAIRECVPYLYEQLPSLLPPSLPSQSERHPLPPPQTPSPPSVDCPRHRRSTLLTCHRLTNDHDDCTVCCIRPASSSVSGSSLSSHNQEEDQLGRPGQEAIEQERPGRCRRCPTEYAGRGDRSPVKRRRRRKKERERER